jgi:hypothetical protein
MKKPKVPHATKELEATYKRVNKKIAQHGELSIEEIDEIIHNCHTKKRQKA